MARPCTSHAAAQLQPIHALRLACGAQNALFPVAVGAMNIHDVCDRQTDVIRASSLNAPVGRGIISYCTNRRLMVARALICQHVFPATFTFACPLWLLLLIILHP